MAVTRTFAQVRSDFATRIAGSGIFWLADVPADVFGPSLVADAIPASRAHLAFAVGIEESSPAVDRQKVVDGVETVSRVAVHFLSRVTPKDQLTALDVGLAAEMSLIQRVMAAEASWPLYFQVRWDGCSRVTQATGEWRHHVVRFLVYHRIALA